MRGSVVIEGELNSAPTPGQSTPLDIRIHEGGLDYFGRLLIQAPEGCRLEADRLFGGSFRWDEQKNVAVISWLKLPEPDQFDIRLDLRVAPNAPSGPQTLEWEFSFIRNNDRETVRPAPLHFALGLAEAPDPTPPNTGLPSYRFLTPSPMVGWRREPRWALTVLSKWNTPFHRDVMWRLYPTEEQPYERKEGN